LFRPLTRRLRILVVETEDEARGCDERSRASFVTLAARDRWIHRPLMRMLGRLSWHRYG
jgi:hypothetical protein